MKRVLYFEAVETARTELWDAKKQTTVEDPEGPEAEEAEGPGSGTDGEGAEGEAGTEDEEGEAGDSGVRVRTAGHQALHDDLEVRQEVLAERRSEGQGQVALLAAHTDQGLDNGAGTVYYTVKKNVEKQLTVVAVPVLSCMW